MRGRGEAEAQGSSVPVSFPKPRELPSGGRAHRAFTREMKIFSRDTLFVKPRTWSLSGAQGWGPGGGRQGEGCSASSGKQQGIPREDAPWADREGPTQSPGGRPRGLPSAPVLSPSERPLF